MAITEVLPQRHDLIWNREGRSALTVLIFLVPGHLDGFELRFVRPGGIARKAGQLDDPFVHVREAHRKRIGVREFVGQSDGDVFKVVPAKCRRHAQLLSEIVVYWGKSHKCHKKSAKKAPPASAVSPCMRIASSLPRSVFSRRITLSRKKPAYRAGYFLGTTSITKPTLINSKEKKRNKIFIKIKKSILISPKRSSV